MANPKSTPPSQYPKSPTFIFAGGGSGGHISPGLAIAERLAELDPSSKSIFVCSSRAIDAAMLRDAGAEFVPVPATPPSKQPLAASRCLINFFKSKRIVSQLIRSRNVSRVVTLGGFVAAPAVSAARSCGIPITLINLDTPPGKANLWMAKRADEIISAIALPDMPGFASRVVGMPIRRRTLAPTDAATCRARLGLDPSLPTLLITGASQGATSINSFMVALADSDPELFRGWQIHHLAGHGADESIRDAYKAAGIQALVEPFQNEMGLAWGAADLAISRAGASSVAEAAQNCVPTLFLPYPYHKDMHQKHNAQPLVELGAAAIQTDLIDVPQNLQTIGPVLRDLMQNSARRASMRQVLRENPQPDAARTIAQSLLTSQ